MGRVVSSDISLNQAQQAVVFTDSDWAGDVETRKSWQLVVVFSWELLRFTTGQKLQANLALSSGEAELNSAVKGISEAIGLRELLREILQVTVTIRIHVDASACKGMLLPSRY